MSNVAWQHGLGLAPEPVAGVRLVGGDHERGPGGVCMLDSEGARCPHLLPTDAVARAARRPRPCDRAPRWISRSTGRRQCVQPVPVEVDMPQVSPNSPHHPPKAGVAGSNPAGGTSEKTPDRSWSGDFDICIWGSTSGRASADLQTARGVPYEHDISATQGRRPRRAPPIPEQMVQVGLVRCSWRTGTASAETNRAPH